jgi:8-oxo-dGTP diphosphatase
VAHREVGPDLVVAMTALDLEYGALRRQFSGWRPLVLAAGTRFETTVLPGTDRAVALGLTGVGNLAAAVLTERAIAELRPRAVLFVGVAGALQEEVRLGDIVVGTKVYSYHRGAEDDTGFRARPEVWPVRHDWEQLARQVAAAGRWKARLSPDPRCPDPKIHFRPIAAGEVVLKSRISPVAQLLRERYGDAAAIEMESGGAAIAGHLNRSLPVLTVRGISDRADGAKQIADGAGWQPVAAANAAAFAATLALELEPMQADRAEAHPVEGDSTESTTGNPAGGVTNVVTGTVSGPVIQAGVISGGLWLGGSPPPPAETRREPGPSPM